MLYSTTCLVSRGGILGIGLKAAIGHPLPNGFLQIPVCGHATAVHHLLVGDWASPVLQKPLLNVFPLVRVASLKQKYWIFPASSNGVKSMTNSGANKVRVEGFY